MKTDIVLDVWKFKIGVKYYYFGVSKRKHQNCVVLIIRRSWLSYKENDLFAYQGNGGYAARAMLLQITNSVLPNPSANEANSLLMAGSLWTLGTLCSIRTDCTFYIPCCTLFNPSITKLHCSAKAMRRPSNTSKFQNFSL